MRLKTNHTLEFFKLLASFMVIFIHIPFYGQMGDIVNGLARFAVPLFLLISGFYSYQIPPQSIKKRIRNILTLIIFGVVCCTAYNILELLVFENIDGLIHYFGRYTDLNAILDFLLFNMPISILHLWYLFAIVYVYIVFYIVTALRLNEKVIFAVSFLLLFLHILLGEGLSMFGISINMIYVRNFALMGIPFFSLGLLARKYEDKIRSIPNYVSIISALVGIIATVLSRIFLKENELHIGSIFILFAIVCVFIKYPDAKFPRILTLLEGCSTYIYIFHLVIASVLIILYSKLGIDIYSSVALTNLHPIVVCVCSTVFSYILVKILKLLKQKSK